MMRLQSSTGACASLLKVSAKNAIFKLISSDRSSYSDSVLLLVRRQLFQILSIYANIAIMNDVL